MYISVGLPTNAGIIETDFLQSTDGVNFSVFEQRSFPINNAITGALSSNPENYTFNIKALKQDGTWTNTASVQYQKPVLTSVTFGTSYTFTWGSPDNLDVDHTNVYYNLTGNLNDPMQLLGSIASGGPKTLVEGSSDHTAHPYFCIEHVDFHGRVGMKSLMVQLV